jgi:L-ascorbate metabolism protein UlaG (beta-lactamase superfamily)
MKEFYHGATRRRRRFSYQLLHIIKKQFNMNGMNRWYRHGKALLSEIADSRPQPEEAYVWFMGQHGFIINLGGKVFYIDVILNDLLDTGNQSLRVYPPPFEPGEIQRVDYVLCTHNHIDHLNLKTLLPLAQANPASRFVVPAPCKNLLTGADIAEDRVLSARVGKNLDLDSVALIPVPAVHTRLIQDEGEKDENGDYTALGFVLKGGGISIYHSGDTWVTPPLIRSLRALGPFDIAMLPINGSDWERTEKNCIGNMCPLDAVKLARSLPIDLVFPAHYDMIAHNSENPARFAEAMYTHCPDKRFHVSAPGECFVYKN